MKNKLLAVRYSKAVLENLTLDEHKSFLEDIGRIQEIITLTGSLLLSLDSFLYTPEQRKALAEVIISGLKHIKIWKNLFLILGNKRKFSLLPVLLDTLEKMIFTRNDMVKVRLKLAFKQSDAVIEEIKQYVNSVMKKKIIFEIIIAPEIIGGFVAETDYIGIDGSIKNNLVKFTQLG